MSAFSLHKLLIRKAALLFLPALLIVGANFIANSGIETPALAFHKAGFTKVATDSPVAVFDAATEGNETDGTDAEFLISELPGFADEAPQRRESFHSPETHNRLSQIAFSLSPRAPPAL